jgi:hypothetical protein
MTERVSLFIREKVEERFGARLRESDLLSGLLRCAGRVEMETGAGLPRRQS